MQPKFIDIRITAISDTDLEDVLIALRKIQYCGDIGANRLLPLQIDGDGSGGVDIHLLQNSGGKNLKNIREFVKLNPKELEKVKNGEDFDTYFIGE